MFQMDTNKRYIYYIKTQKEVVGLTLEVDCTFCDLDMDYRGSALFGLKLVLGVCLGCCHTASLRRRSEKKVFDIHAAFKKMNLRLKLKRGSFRWLKQQ